MTLSEIEAIEAAWRVLNKQSSETAQVAAASLIAFLDEIDDAGVIDRLNKHRSARDIIAGMKASLRIRR